MRKMKMIILLFICLGLFFSGSCRGKKPDDGALGPEPPLTSEKYKILHIMSYHSPWKWTDDQLNGFQDVLKDLDIEYKVLQLNQKNLTESELAAAVQEAKDTIKNWQPDLVYTTDDYVQESVVKEYIDTDLPFVFSGVNLPPEEYGFKGSKNMAGVLEYELFIPVINVLKKIVPDLKRIAIITDEGTMWLDMVKRMQAKALESLPDIEIVQWDFLSTFEEYKQKIRGYQDSVDAIGLLGVFLFKDAAGNNVPFSDVLEWTTENSNVPDFSFWADRIPKGTLCSVAVSGYEQGLAAGRIARAILVDKKSPASIPFQPTIKGEPVISLARANKIGLQIDSDLLLTAEVVKEFVW